MMVAYRGANSTRRTDTQKEIEKSQRNTNVVLLAGSSRHEKHQQLQIPKKSFYLERAGAMR